MNTLQSWYKLRYFNLTVSSLYLVKLKIARNQPIAYCSTFFWTNRSKLSQKVVQCSFISLFVRKFLSSLPKKNL